MKVLCNHYTNLNRMCLVLDRLTSMHDLVLHPVRGALVLASSGYSCSGDCVEVVLYSNELQDPILLTTDKKYAPYDQTVIDYSLDQGDNLCVQLIQICAHKFSSSANPFEVDCYADGCTITAKCSKDSDGLEYIIKAPRGEIVASPSGVTAGMLQSCNSLKRFGYSVTTNTCARGVTVSGGQLEILREISHYCGKSLVFTKVSDGKIVRQYCVTNNGCCELIQPSNGKPAFVKRIPFTKMVIDFDCSVQAVDITFESFMRFKSFSEAMRGGVSRA